MQLPFKSLYPLTQEFGVNPEYYKQFLVTYPDGKKYPMKGHNGLDFGVPHNTEIFAPHSGKVIEAQYDASGYGNYVKVENEKEGSVLAHLDRIDVKVGYQLAEGDHIGWSDNTGYSTGPHLHWGWYIIPRDRNNGIAGFYNQTLQLNKAGIILQLGKNPILPVVNTEKPQSGHLYTAEEYNAAMKDRDKFWKERDDALEEAKQLRGEIARLNDTHSAFAAMGYNTVDDIANLTKDKDATILALQKENASVRQRNATLAEEIRKMEEEDHTAAELGQQQQQENKDLKETVSEIAKASEVEKPTAKNIVSKIFTLREFAERFARSREEKAMGSVASDNLRPAATYGITWLLNLFNIIPKDKEVK